MLAYTVYYISQNPSSQVRLRTELATLKPSMHEADCTLSNGAQHHQGTGESRLPSPSSLDELPYLSAILKESFRMRPTSTPLPRITPRDRTVSLAGVDGILPGTRVNVFQWFIHRNPENYSQANEWYPDRWLEPALKDGKSPLLWAFGGGSRMCVGVSLTQYRTLSPSHITSVSCINFPLLRTLRSHEVYSGHCICQFLDEARFKKSWGARTGINGG